MKKRSVDPLKLREFDASEYLTNEAAIAAFLTDMMKDGNPALLADALNTVFRAWGITEIAKRAGLTREAVCKALQPDAHPSFDTMQRVCTALGVRLVARARDLRNG